MYKPAALDRNPKVDLYLELTGLVSGAMLVVFLWVHAFLLATVILGASVFDNLAGVLERYYLTQVSIGLVFLIALTHIVSVARRIPTGYREHRSVWRIAGAMRHTDTYVWAFQAVTGLAILVLAFTHIWVVLADWPLEAMKSAHRIQTDYLPFYIILLLFGEYHGGVGIYRQLVKWGRFRRRSAAFAVVAAFAFILAVNLGILWALFKLENVQ